jgi:hypothetical protein
METASHRPAEEYRKAVRILVLGLLILIVCVFLELKADLPREEVVKSVVAFLVILLTDVLRSGVRKESKDRLWIMAAGTYLIDRLTLLVTPTTSQSDTTESKQDGQELAPRAQGSPGAATDAEPARAAAHEESVAASAEETSKEPHVRVPAESPAEPTKRAADGAAARSDALDAEFSKEGDRYGKWVRRSRHWEREN